MTYAEYANAEDFLAVARPALERRECLNSLMLGVCLRCAREPNGGEGRPYFATIGSAAGLCMAAIMTPPYNLQIHVEDADGYAGLEVLANALLDGKWQLPGVLAPDAVANAFASLWCDKTAVSNRTRVRMGFHELRRVLHPAYPRGVFRQASIDDIELVRRWAFGFHDDVFDDGQHDRTVQAAEAKLKAGTDSGGDLFFWVDGDPVAMAAKSRPTPHGESVIMVYTPPEQRNKGYASAVVARLSQKILDDGKQFCVLYTDVANPTSNSIYRKLGYTKIAEVAEIVFASEADSR